jgi:hypothetical protein
VTRLRDQFGREGVFDFGIYLDAIRLLPRQRFDFGLGSL